MPKALVVLGLCGSGKSHLIEARDLRLFDGPIGTPSIFDEAIAGLKPSAEFGQWVKLRDSVDPRTFAFDCFENRSMPSKPEAVPADAWLNASNLRTNEMIPEESCSMPFYDAALTLLWIKDVIETTGSVDYLDEMDPEDFTSARRKWPGKR
jgi:hypothetical protein